MNDEILSRYGYLVVDDDDFSCEVVSSVLGLLVCTRVQTATEPQAALNLARQHRPDFVLLDIYMPEADGWSMLEQMRRIAPQAAVVMVTGLGMQADFLKSMDQQADGFCIKPVSAEVMRKTLLGARQRRQSHAALR